MDLGQLYKKYKDIVPYLFFGICTTLVNVGVYWTATRLLVLGTMPSTVIAWFLAVMFAYITNRKWVFHSGVKGYRAVLAEMFSFFSCRLATGMMDWICMFFFADILAWNDVGVKAAANVLVIILNYIASKLVVFRR